MSLVSDVSGARAQQETAARKQRAERYEKTRERNGESITDGEIYADVSLRRRRGRRDEGRGRAEMQGSTEDGRKTGCQLSNYVQQQGAKEVEER